MDNTVLVLLLTKWEIFTEPYLKEKEEPKESSFLDNTDTDFKILTLSIDRVKGKGSRIQGKISLIISKILRQLVTLINLKRLIIVCVPKQINVSYHIQFSYRSTNHAF